MIPYWVASASNDGLIKIWDIRYDSDAVITLEGHDNIVRKVSTNKECVYGLYRFLGLDSNRRFWHPVVWITNSNYGA